MKCDELKDKWFNAYPEIMGIEGTEPTKCYGKADVDAAIAELKDENAELKDEIKRLENVRKVHIEGIESMSEGLKLDAKQICKTQRALWLARAERAHVIILLWNVYCYQNNCLYYRDFLNIKCNPFRSLPKKTAMEWSDLWESIETKCREKAKEFV